MGTLGIDEPGAGGRRGLLRDGPRRAEVTGRAQPEESRPGLAAERRERACWQHSQRLAVLRLAHRRRCALVPRHRPFGAEHGRIQPAGEERRITRVEEGRRVGLRRDPEQRSGVAGAQRGSGRRDLALVEVPAVAVLEHVRDEPRLVEHDVMKLPARVVGVACERMRPQRLRQPGDLPDRVGHVRVAARRALADQIDGPQHLMQRTDLPEVAARRVAGSIQRERAQMRGMTDRVDLGDEPAVRGAQHVEAVDAECAANGVDVVGDCRRAVVGDRPAQLCAAGSDGSQHRAHTVLKRRTVDRARSARAARVHEQQIASIEQWAELVEVTVPLARRRDARAARDREDRALRGDARVSVRDQRETDRGRAGEWIGAIERNVDRAAHTR